MPEKRSFEGENACFKNIKCAGSSYQTDSSETRTLYCVVFIVHHLIFLRAHSFKNEDLQLLFLTFQDERLESQNVSNEGKPDEKITEYNKQSKTKKPGNRLK